jgi:lipopolysaccharide biosynthesis regulator YciM
LLAQQAGETAALAFLEAELQDHPTLLGLCHLLELKLAAGETDGPTELIAIYRISKQLFDQAARYRCERCGFFSKALHWHCPRCKHWSSLQPLPGQAGHERT